MRSCAQSSQRSTCPPSAEVRQVSIADITFNWARLRWPALALRHAAQGRLEAAHRLTGQKELLAATQSA